MNAVEREGLKKVRQWLEYGDEDLRLAEHAMKIEGACPCRLVAYHAQQCAEKHLKAYLVFHTVDFPYTHDLQALLALCSEHGGWAKDLKQARKLTYYAISARYPGEDDEVTPSDARDAIELAGLVRTAVRAALKKEGLNNNGR